MHDMSCNQPCVTRHGLVTVLWLAADRIAHKAWYYLPDLLAVLYTYGIDPGTDAEQVEQVDAELAALLRRLCTRCSFHSCSIRPWPVARLRSLGRSMAPPSSANFQLNRRRHAFVEERVIEHLVREASGGAWSGNAVLCCGRPRCRVAVSGS